MARKVLSHIPGWGADPDDMSHDAEPGSLDVQVPSKEYFLARDAGSFEGLDKFDKDVRDMIQLANRIISHKPECSGLKGFTHFLYHQRLYPESTVENLTEIALELGVHKSTAFRLVATLEAHRLVEQTSDRGRYRLGMGILRLAGATTARLDLVRGAESVWCESGGVDGVLLHG